MNERQERFAQLVAGGMGHSAAYSEAGYVCKSPAVDSAAASRLLRHVSVAARISELREKNAEMSEIGRDEVLKFYAEILRSTPDKAAPDNPLCELKMSKAGPYFAFPDKHKAAEGLRKMCGFDAPEKTELSASDSLVELIGEIRGR